MISIATIIVFALLAKKSLDLVVELSLQHDVSSYEDLGRAAYGTKGKLLVMGTKFAYSFGCLVAYTVVIQDNFSPAIFNLIYGKSTSDPHNSSDWLFWLLSHDVWCTWLVSSVIVLPLCLLRDMTHLTSASAISVISKASLVVIVIYLWCIHIDNQLPPESSVYYRASEILSRTLSSGSDSAWIPISDLFFQHWLKICWIGYFNNIGTFVFVFVCQHTVHLAYNSIKPEIRTFQTWKCVSTWSLVVSCVVSLAIGVFAYATFWEKTQSDLFQNYPESVLLDQAKILLCISMLLTFPLPFFTCRELVIVFFFPFAPSAGRNTVESRNVFSSFEEPLLTSREEGIENDDNQNENIVVRVSETDYADVDVAEPIYPVRVSSLDRNDSMANSIASMDLSVLSSRAIEVMNSVLLPGEERQLKFSYHLGLTFKLWFFVTAFAIASPNLGDVLALVGCAGGTLISFLLPGCFAIRLQGYSHLAGFLVVIGSIVGAIGTTCSLRQFMEDVSSSNK